ncbi:SGNH/GDSL hydrolase family protein [Phycicoccus sp.]|uniref:SGNH/GDSL hydrolase family protein n=1 Tax=Phycicoccus sp. TaxID=1902410 RepID=UPI002C07F905|nr:SGNH/GDSL hydrolase family protein [Phycicoccus sp.]HMM95032.1 SGNH/GDSL hydrolase family protein [Phycicoccus sp.]
MPTSLQPIPLTADLVHGALDLETTPAGGLRPHRLPAWARAQNADEMLAVNEAQPSGVRVAGRTRATVVELDAVVTRRALTGAPARAPGSVDLVVDGEVLAGSTVPNGDLLTTDIATGVTELTRGGPGTVRFELPAGEKVLELWLPHQEGVELLALRADAPLEPLPTGDRPRWVHHGSSISHGSNAVRPTGTWPAVAARLGRLALVNLGFGGSAVLDPFVARTMRDTAADLLSLKVGINIVGGDLMRRRVFGPAVHGFLDTLREGHPTTPLLVVTPVLCPIHEDTPGPGAVDPVALQEGRLVFTAVGDPAEVPAGRLTLRTVREELARVVEQRRADDPNLHLVDGLGMYGAGDVDALPLPDALHPDAETHQLMGERFARTVFGAGGPFPTS